MNRYPLWKYLLILAAVVVGLVYTLPNFYGEVPAVQVSPLRSNLKVDAALMSRVEDALKKAGLSPEGVALDATSVKARFGSTEDQQGQGCRSIRTRRRLRGGAEPADTQPAVADIDRGAADVPRPRFARWRAFPDAGRHEVGAGEEARFLHQRHPRHGIG